MVNVLYSIETDGSLVEIYRMEYNTTNNLLSHVLMEYIFEKYGWKDFEGNKFVFDIDKCFSYPDAFSDDMVDFINRSLTKKFEKGEKFVRVKAIINSIFTLEGAGRKFSLKDFVDAWELSDPYEDRMVVNKEEDETAKVNSWRNNYRHWNPEQQDMWWNQDLDGEDETILNIARSPNIIRKSDLKRLSDVFYTIEDYSDSIPIIANKLSEIYSETEKDLFLISSFDGVRDIQGTYTGNEITDVWEEGDSWDLNRYSGRNRIYNVNYMIRSDYGVICVECRQEFDQEQDQDVVFFRGCYEHVPFEEKAFTVTLLDRSVWQMNMKKFYLLIVEKTGNKYYEARINAENDVPISIIENYRDIIQEHGTCIKPAEEIDEKINWGFGLVDYTT